MRGLEGLSFEQSDCKVVFDVNSKNFLKEMKAVIADIKDNWSRQEPTLYFIYYAGHGVMRNNQTYAVLGTEKDRIKALFPLEAQLRSLSKARGAAIVGVLACCRERFDTRGSGEAAPYEELQGDEQNLYITFGCPPNRSVPGATTISKAYFAQLKERADGRTGAVTLPQALMFWQIHGSEPLSLLARPLELQHADWEPVEGADSGPQANDQSAANREIRNQLNAVKDELALKQEENKELKSKHVGLTQF